MACPSHPALYRSTVVTILFGGSRKVRDQLGWVPCVGLDELAGMQKEAGLARVAWNQP